MSDMEKINQRLDQIFDWHAEHQEIFRDIANSWHAAYQAYVRQADWTNLLAHEVKALKEQVESMTTGKGEE